MESVIEIENIKNTLETFPTIEKKRRYCDNNLNILGVGSSRAAYEVSDSFVVKVSLNPAGMAQNKVEAYCQRNRTTELLAKVFDHAHDFSWILMERGNPLEDKGEFTILSGIDNDVFRAVITYWYAENIQKARHKQFEPEGYESNLKNPFIKEVCEIIRECALLPGDISKYTSWALIGDRLALIDFGLTREIYMKYFY